MEQDLASEMAQGMAASGYSDTACRQLDAAEVAVVQNLRNPTPQVDSDSGSWAGHPHV